MQPTLSLRSAVVAAIVLAPTLSTGLTLPWTFNNGVVERTANLGGGAFDAAAAAHEVRDHFTVKRAGRKPKPNKNKGDKNDDSNDGDAAIPRTTQTVTQTATPSVLPAGVRSFDAAAHDVVKREGDDDDDEEEEEEEEEGGDYYVDFPRPTKTSGGGYGRPTASGTARPTGFATGLPSFDKGKPGADGLHHGLVDDDEARGDPACGSGPAEPTGGFGYGGKRTVPSGRPTGCGHGPAVTGRPMPTGAFGYVSR